MIKVLTSFNNKYAIRFSRGQIWENIVVFYVYDYTDFERITPIQAGYTDCGELPI